MSTLRDSSRQTWNGGNSIEHINAGSLQRIADACERMAVRHTELIEERDRYARWHKDEQARRERWQRKHSAALGQITKLRKKLAASQATKAEVQA